MNRHIVILLTLLTLVICSPNVLYVCSAEANGDADTPTFTLALEPAHPKEWVKWRPKYKDNVSFIATISGETATGVEITRFTNVSFTFDLGTPSQWKGVCMNFNGDTDVEDSYDLFFRKEDNASGSGYTYTVTRSEDVPGENETGLGMTETDGGNSSVPVNIRVNDYAAVGILSASASFNYDVVKHPKISHVCLRCL